jgi:ribokinase
MRVLNIGSLNVDEIFSVASFVRPGETISCRGYARNAGGKGNNQSIALARAGAQVSHAGKVGSDGTFLVELLREAGVDVSRIAGSAAPSGRAIIQVDAAGQNCIILLGGANQDIARSDIDAFLDGWGKGDALLLQNEISNVDHALEEAARRGLRVFLNPSPMTAEIMRLPLEKTGCLIFNEVEGEALTGEPDPVRILASLRGRCPRTDLVLTLGAAGLRYSGADGSAFALPARKVTAVDSTAAGDTFTGYFIAALARGDGPERALDEGIRAAAICVSRAGAVPSIPLRCEIA